MSADELLELGVGDRQGFLAGLSTPALVKLSHELLDRLDRLQGAHAACREREDDGRRELATVGRQLEEVAEQVVSVADSWRTVETTEDGLARVELERRPFVALLVAAERHRELVEHARSGRLLTSLEGRVGVARSGRR